jgi:hypothetical protein
VSRSTTDAFLKRRPGAGVILPPSAASCRLGPMYNNHSLSQEVTISPRWVASSSISLGPADLTLSECVSRWSVAPAIARGRERGFRLKQPTVEQMAHASANARS